MIIVEGTDCTGKTTLCHKLLDRLPTHTYSHLSRPPVEFDCYYDYVNRINRRIVQDRFHLSEIVYARVRKDTTMLSPEVYRMVDAKLRLVGALTILLVADESLLEERYGGKDEMYSLNGVLEANRNFRGLVENSALSEYTCDIDRVYFLDSDNPYVSEEQVTSVLRDYEERQYVLNTIINRKNLYEGV